MTTTRQGVTRSLSESSLDDLNSTILKNTSKKMTLLRSDQLSNKSQQQHKVKYNNFQLVSSVVDIAIRVSLVLIFIKLEVTPAFKRKIHSEELWLYKNPPTKDYVPAFALLLSVILGPFLITFLHFVITRDRYDFTQSSNVWTLALGLTGLATSLLKITVGRPRPDFFYRCYPDGISNLTTDDKYGENCTGIEHIINEGRKSFPSGHASFAFTSFGFIACYLSGKLHVFNERGRGQSWRLCIISTPLIIAFMVAISRICDYHHHWQDVLIGGLIGLFVTYLCYRQYYPSIFSRNSQRPLTKRNYRYLLESGNCYSNDSRGNTKTKGSIDNIRNGSFDASVSGNDERRPLITDDKDNKWI